jgi:hypothetical protein
MVDAVQIRQGDVLLEPVDVLPRLVRGTPARDWRGRLAHVLAEGERTGHAHTIEAKDGVTLLETPSRETYLVVDDEAVELEHQEHANQEVVPGIYRVMRQRSYVYKSTLPFRSVAVSD